MWLSSARESDDVNAEVTGGAWKLFLFSNFFGLCRSKAVEDPCRVSFVKFLTSLHKFEGLFHGVLKDFGGAWQRIWPFLG